MHLTKPCLALLFGLCTAHVAPAATLAVTSTADDGSPGTLRSALELAANGDTIDLTGLSGTIALVGGELVVEKDLIVAGPGPAQLTVDGQFESRVFSIAPGATVTLAGLTIANGYDSSFVSDGAGGGILNELGNLTVTNCVLSGNSADVGGGIFNDGGLLLFGDITGNATLTVIDSTLVGNFAESSVGGGILNAGFTGSSATLNLVNSTLVENSAAQGGGLGNFGNTARATLHSSTLSGNFAETGGAIFNNQGAVLTLNNATLSDNFASSDQGGGIANQQGTLRLRNTLLNAGPGGANLWVDPSLPGTVQSYGNNLSSDDGAGFLVAAGDVVSTAPLLGPLQDNGGLTMTHALLAGSPAIDAGAATDVDGFTITSDQRGLVRPQGSAVDIGAFEFEQAPSGHVYSWSGVLRPINADGSSIFKAGSTIPVKFMLTGDDAGVTDLVATLAYARLSDGVVGAINEAESKATADAGNQFRYDPATGQYIYNWSTKGLGSGACRLFLDLGDGVERTVDVGLK
jgi:hypothetical protein